MNNFLNIEKTKLYEDLVEYLISAQNKHDKNCIGWAREANLSTSSCMNTSEVLLGLLYSNNVIAQNSLSHKVRQSIAGGVEFLLNEQCNSGGWTTSENNGDRSAKGNVITSALAVWCITEYVLLHGKAEKFKMCMDKSSSFFESCKMNDTTFSFRPSSKEFSNMATLYGIIGVLNLNIFYAELEDEPSKVKTYEIINSFFEQVHIESLSPFERVILFIVLKKTKNFLKMTGCKYENFDFLYKSIEKNIKELPYEKYTECYVDIRYVRENGEKTEFPYYTPIWVLVALSYGESIETDYKNELIGNILNTYLRYKDNKFHVIVSDREWTWATAQTLMAFSMYSDTQKLFDFFDINSFDHQNVFVVYGRNYALKQSVENCLKAMGLKPITYNNDNGNIDSTLNAVIKGMEASSATIVLLTGDDEGRCRKKYLLKGDKTKNYEKNNTPQPRLNVVFEAGYSLAYRKNKNTIIVTTNEVRTFSDIDGVNKIIIDIDRKGKPTLESLENFKAKLVDTLKACGCEMNNDAKSIISSIPIEI